MLRVLLTALFIVSGGVHALEPPSPAPSKASQEQKDSASKPAKETKTTQSETKNAPLSMTFDSPVTIQKSEQDRQEDAKEIKHKASNEWWLVFWTAALASITLLLATITSVLARYTYKLWYDTSKASVRQAGEMRESLSIAKQSADAAKTSADTGYNQFIAAHRPRIIVRRCFHVPKSGPPAGAPAVEYVIANYGDTAATIVELSTSLWDNQAGGALRWNPSIPSYDPSVPVSIRIDSGAAITKMHDKNAEKFFTAVDARAAPEPWSAPTIGSDLLFLGYIVYEDNIGTKRVTAFCRAYKRSAKRFIPIDDKDYEYQD
jgi:hypothetical protein